MTEPSRCHRVRPAADGSAPPAFRTGPRARQAPSRVPETDAAHGRRGMHDRELPLASSPSVRCSDLKLPVARRRPSPRSGQRTERHIQTTTASTASSTPDGSSARAIGRGPIARSRPPHTPGGPARRPPRPGASTRFDAVSKVSAAAIMINSPLCGFSYTGFASSQTKIGTDVTAPFSLYKPLILFIVPREPAGSRGSSEFFSGGSGGRRERFRGSRPNPFWGWKLRRGE
jgi:hypothetical protein